MVDGDGESLFVVVSCSGGGGLSFDGCGLDFQCWWWQLFLGNFDSENCFRGNFGGGKWGLWLGFDGGWWCWEYYTK